MKKILFVLVGLVMSVSCFAENVWEKIPYKGTLDEITLYLNKYGYIVTKQDTVVDERPILCDKTIFITTYYKDDNGNKCYVAHKIFIKNDKYNRERIKGYSDKGDKVDETWYILVEEGYAYYINDIVFAFEKPVPKLPTKAVSLGDVWKEDYTYGMMYKNYYMIMPTYKGTDIMKNKLKDKKIF